MVRPIFTHMLTDTSSVTQQELTLFGFKQVSEWNQHQLYQAGQACIVLSKPQSTLEHKFIAKHPAPGVYAIALHCSKSIISHFQKHYSTKLIDFGHFTVTCCFDPFEDILLYLMDKKACEQFKNMMSTPHQTAINYTFDHFAIALESDKLNSIQQFFIENFQFNTIYNLDIDTGTSGMRSIAIADQDINIRVPLVAPYGKNSQVQLFLDEFKGQGVQHIGLHCHDILATCDYLSKQGIEFLTAPPHYYNNQNTVPNISTDQYKLLQHYHILYDVIDEDHYLLQCFCKSTTDSPFFFEILQRHHHDTFTERNIRSLFESVELTQTTA